MKFVFFLFLVISSQFVFSQSILEGTEEYKRGDLRVLFYNVENCFDCFDDSLKIDNEFLPHGIRNWTWKKYKQKTNKIAKVIMAAGGWQFPDLIGLCEIENRFALNGIFKNTPLKNIDYQIIHRESPDRRGIDVALIYQPEVFSPIDTTFIPLIYRGENKSTTREILYVKGKLRSSDTIHVFVNHWPSRWGGQLESENKRISAARLLRNKLDSILQTNTKANLLIMGDFNDYPGNESIKNILKAEAPEGILSDNNLYNLAFQFENKGGIASHKYQGKWGMLDQFMVSGTLLNRKSILYCDVEGMSIFAPDFLLEADESYYGIKPFRTFTGYKFHGGYSDHLPIILDFWSQ